MSFQYFKRFRMEFDLAQALPAAELPEDYVWAAWQPGEVDRHAWAKFQSFRDEVDSEVFPCLGDYRGCYHLMRDISEQAVFAPTATWLVVHAPPGEKPVDCGTIQGLALTETLGSIQNVGVAPEHRRRRLGQALVLKALHGFRSLGLERVSLEVTAANFPAVQLYRSLGFTQIRTMYRSAELEVV